MTANPGNSYQMMKVRVTIVACDPTQRLIHGRFKDGGTTSIAVFEIGQAFRWPQVGEIWTVTKQNNYWILGSRLNNDQFEVLPVTAISGTQIRLDGSPIFDDLGNRLLSITASGNIAPLLLTGSGIDMQARITINAILQALGI